MTFPQSPSMGRFTSNGAWDVHIKKVLESTRKKSINYIV